MTIMRTLGPSGYLIFLLAAGIIAITAKNIYSLYIKRAIDRPESTEHGLTSILVLSTVIVAVGFLGTFFGLSSMFESIQAAGSISPGVIMGGIAFAIQPIILSLAMFSVFSLVWFVLRYRFKRLLEQQAQ